MSSLTEIDKRYLEKLFGMSSGYVLDFKDAGFGDLFKKHKISIHSSKYETYGTSKAKKLRAFWEIESDLLVGNVLNDIMDVYVADCNLNNREIDNKLLEQSRSIASRLTGQKAKPSKVDNVNDFLMQEFTINNIKKLPVEQQVIPIIEKRLEEARIALGAGANLSVILLCGSVLEAVLLGAAQKEPSKFNKANSSPRNCDGKVKQFHEWTLAQFIDVSCEINLIKPDIKTFGHGLRDFRNYIHPYQQMLSGFTPDQHTAKVCFQVLKAAIAELLGER